MKYTNSDGEEREAVVCYTTIDNNVMHVLYDSVTGERIGCAQIVYHKLP